MSKEKQIEEMAHFICESRKANWADGCRVCSHHENRCLYQDIACSLYNAGYHKQSEGHWYRHDKKKHGDTCYYCSVCEKMALSDGYCWELTDYCPNCGAKMKGGEDNA